MQNPLWALLYGTATLWKVDVKSSKNLARFWAFLTRFWGNAILYGTAILWKVDVKSSNNLARFWVFLTRFWSSNAKTTTLPH